MTITRRHFIDNAPTPTLTGAINSSVTSVVVSSVAGLPSSFPYSGTIELGSASAEQVLVTAAVGTTLTVTRNSNGLGAFSHASAATFNHTAIAQDYDEANAHTSASSAVHGITGAVVGDTDTQTLTNKTLTSPAVNGATINAASTLGGVSGTSLAADRTAWTTYTPTFTNCTSPVGEFAYKTIGKTMFIRGHFASGTATANGFVHLSVPGGLTAAGTGSTLQMVPGFIQGYALPGWSIQGGASILESPAALSAGSALSGGYFTGVLEIA